MPPEFWWLAACAGSLALGWFLSERHNRQSLECGRAMHDVSSRAADQVLSAAQQQHQVAANVKALAEAYNAGERSLAERLAALERVVDSLDRSQGAVLAGLVNSRIIRAVDSNAGPARQVGEPDEDFVDRVDHRIPPLSESEDLSIR